MLGLGEDLITGDPGSDDVTYNTLELLGADTFFISVVTVTFLTDEREEVLEPGIEEVEGAVDVDITEVFLE